MPVELWYIDVIVNNLNAQVYVDLVNAMRELGNGVFTCTYRLNNGIISDLVTFENETYVEPTPTKVNQVS